MQGMLLGDGMGIGRIFQSPLATFAKGEADGLTVEAIFHRHADDVHRIVRRLLGPASDAADADDLTQQVFIAVHRGLPRFRRDSKVSTWVYGITARTVLHHLRTERRYKQLMSSLEIEAEHSGDAEEALANKEALRRVWECLLEIKPKKRVVYVLYQIEGMTGAEIAEALDVSEATVRSRLHHAKKELMAKLARKEARR